MTPRTIRNQRAAVALVVALLSISAVLLPPSRADAQGGGPSIVRLGFGQDGPRVVVAAIIANTDPNLGFELLPVQVSLFNAAGAPIASNSGYVDMLFPAGKTAYVAAIYPPGGERAARATINLGRGRASATSLPMLLDVTDAVFRPDRFSAKATGLLTSGYPKGLTQILVSAVAFDSSGAIVGGGQQYINQVPGGGQLAVDPSVTVSVQPAWIEMYAAITSISSVEP